MADIDLEPELLAVVSPTGVPLGSGPRTDVHRDGHWHAVFHCLIVRPGLPARVVLQRRRSGQADLPRPLLDLSATGHLRAGEGPRDGVRELREELGVDVAPDQDLESVGVRLLADDTAEGRNRERVQPVLPRRRPTARALRPRAEREVDSVVEAAVDDLLDPRRRRSRARSPGLEWSDPADVTEADRDPGRRPRRRRSTATGPSPWSWPSGSPPASAPTASEPSRRPRRGR